MGIYNFIYKADLPFKIEYYKNSLMAIEPSDIAGFLRDGDMIISIEDNEVKSKEEIEILLDGKAPGEDVFISVLRSGNILTEKINLTNFYSTFYIIVATVVGLVFFLVAIFVFLKCDNFKLGKTFHWSFIFTSMIILMTWGNYTTIPYGVGTVTRTGFHIGYLFAPLYFLKFSIIFPSRIKLKTKNTLSALSFIALILLAALTFSFYWYILVPELNVMRIYILIFDISSGFIVLLTIAAIAIFIHTYTTTEHESDRKKLRWIILGFLVGPLSYMFFWVIPSRIWNRPVLPEEIVLLLVAFVPITFGIAIIKYRLMNIDLIFNRSIVYSTVISFLVLVYISIVTSFANLINNSDSELSPIIAAVLIAIIFQPLRSRVQKIVDRKFFRISYDYRKALNKLKAHVKYSMKVNYLKLLLS